AGREEPFMVDQREENRAPGPQPDQPETVAQQGSPVTATQGAESGQRADDGIDIPEVLPVLATGASVLYPSIVVPYVSAEAAAVRGGAAGAVLAGAGRAATRPPRAEHRAGGADPQRARALPACGGHAGAGAERAGAGGAEHHQPRQPGRLHRRQPRLPSGGAA